MRQSHQCRVSLPPRLIPSKTSHGGHLHPLPKYRPLIVLTLSLLSIYLPCSSQPFSTPLLLPALSSPPLCLQHTTWVLRRYHKFLLNWIYTSRLLVYELPSVLQISTGLLVVILPAALQNVLQMETVALTLQEALLLRIFGDVLQMETVTSASQEVLLRRIFGNAIIKSGWRRHWKAQTRWGRWRNEPYSRFVPDTLTNGDKGVWENARSDIYAHLVE